LPVLQERRKDQEGQGWQPARPPVSGVRAFI
jgi:hypothetical protein